MPLRQRPRSLVSNLYRRDSAIGPSLIARVVFSYGRELSCLCSIVCRRNLFSGTAVGTGSQSTEPAAPEKTLVRRVLLDVGSFALFRGVSMMFMLYRLLFQHFGITPPTLLAAISWRNWRPAARHDEIQTCLEALRVYNARSSERFIGQSLRPSVPPSRLLGCEQFETASAVGLGHPAGPS
jgi:hypothetical protein